MTSRSRGHDGNGDGDQGQGHDILTDSEFATGVKLVRNILDACAVYLRFQHEIGMPARNVPAEWDFPLLKDVIIAAEQRFRASHSHSKELAHVSDADTPDLSDDIDTFDELDSPSPRQQQHKWMRRIERPKLTLKTV